MIRFDHDNNRAAITCDGCPALAPWVSRADDDGALAASDAADAAGWKRRPDGAGTIQRVYDYCPECSAKRRL